MRKSNKFLSALLALMLGTTVLVSCSNGGEAKKASAGPSRSEAITEITDDVILPGLKKSSASASELDKAVAELCAAPSDASLGDAQDSWRKARDAWMSTSAYRVGPIGELHSKAKISYPINPEKLENLLSSGKTDLDNIDELGADLRGLGGIEYVLFTPADAAALAPERCAYARAAAAGVVGGTNELAAAWTNEYSKKFNAAGQDAIDDLVNASLASLATVGDMTLAPDATDPGAAHNALADAAAELGSVRAVWGNDSADKAPVGLADLVATKSASAAKSFTTSLDSAIDAVDSLASVDDAKATAEAFDHVNDARVKLRTEVASQLGVTVTFTDSDGDG